jgi:hypothetical protein
MPLCTRREARDRAIGISTALASISIAIEGSTARYGASQNDALRESPIAGYSAAHRSWPGLRDNRAERLRPTG